MIVLDPLTFMFVIEIFIEGLLIYGSIRLIEKKPGVALMLTLLTLVVPLFLLPLII